MPFRGDLDWLERWAHANLRMFSKAKCKCWGNPKHEYRLDGEQVESRPEEKDLRVLVDKNLSVTGPCRLAAQKPQPYPGLP